MLEDDVSISSFLAQALPSGPSPPGINYDEISTLQKRREMGRLMYHANIISIQQDLWKFGVVSGVVTSRLVS